MPRFPIRRPPEREREAGMNVNAVFGTKACVSALQGHDFGGATFEFADIAPVHRAFPAVANEDRFDLAELAIVTFLQALDAGRPLSLLPVTLLGRFQHHCLVTLDGDCPVSAGDLAGKRIGVRSYSQTTGVWVRGFLADDYGLDAKQVEWVVYEGGHVAGVEDPAQVVRAPAGAKLPKDFLDGAFDAAIMGNELPADPRVRTVLPQPARAAAAWYARTGAIPVNHLVVARDQFIAENPDLVREICAVLAGVMPATPPISSMPDFYPAGFDALAPSLELAGGYAYDQGLTSRRISAEEIQSKTEALAGASLGRLGP
jgi:4,5-dihydroxyphthalate decarboxylase